MSKIGSSLGPALCCLLEACYEVTGLQSIFIMKVECEFSFTFGAETLLARLYGRTVSFEYKQTFMIVCQIRFEVLKFELSVGVFYFNILWISSCGPVV